MKTPGSIYLFCIIMILTVLAACNPQQTPVVLTPTQAEAVQQPTATPQTTVASPTAAATLEPSPSAPDFGYPTPEPVQSSENAYPSPNQASPGAPSSNNPMDAPAEAPEPTAGNGSISGLLFSPSIDQTIPGTRFYLTPAVGKDNAVPFVFVGPTESEGDVEGQTDENGQFFMDSVPPGKYYLIVWAPPYSWEIVQKMESDQAPLLIEVQAGQKQPLGILYVSWP